jgi:hypothetical protein
MAISICRDGILQVDEYTESKTSAAVVLRATAIQPGSRLAEWS